MSDYVRLLPEGVDARKMTVEQFDQFIQAALTHFKNQVQTHPDYLFAREGETMSLGDWFEQFGCHAGVM